MHVVIKTKKENLHATVPSVPSMAALLKWQNVEVIGDVPPVYLLT